MDEHLESAEPKVSAPGHEASSSPASPDTDWGPPRSPFTPEALPATCPNWTAGSEVAFRPPPAMPWRPVRSPARWRELGAVALLVAVADVTLYRGEGYGGLAVLLAASPVLLILGSPRPRFSGSLGLLGAMLWLMAARVAWLGSPLEVMVGFGLLVAFAMTLAGHPPYVFSVLLYTVQAVAAGCVGLCQYLGAPRNAPFMPSRRFWVNVLLPIWVMVLFGILFVQANPDLAHWCSETIRQAFEYVCEHLEQFLPTWPELLLWIVVAWLAAGLLRPLLRRSPAGRLAARKERRPVVPAEFAGYSALRNTLLSVVVLFAVYLVFEFKTLWFQAFPKGFYYGGYAHAGAAWLTVALGLATLILSAGFSGPVLADPRVGRLRCLAWIWSLENLVLAAAVFHRMGIYIEFNGMTPLRTVGLFGAGAVVAGFLLVVWKIHRGHGFFWLVQRQLWTAAIAVYLLLLTPVDFVVHSYNVWRVMDGDLDPSVQIAWQPISNEGLLALIPLLECQDPTIREGVRSMLAWHAIEGQRIARRRGGGDWTSFQLADRLLRDRLQAQPSDWEPYRSLAKREAAWQKFREYTYQWY